MKEIVLKDISRVIDSKSFELLENLRKMIAIESLEGTPKEGSPFGETVQAALEQVLSIAKEMGFTVHNHEGYVGTIDWGTGSEMIGVLSHVDVVPPGDISAWNTPPFEMTEKDGYLCGRGVVDDKGPLLSALYGLYALKELGIDFKKRVRIIVGTNEETGWGCMKYYLANCEIPTSSICPDGMFTVVNREKGIISATFSKKFSTNVMKDFSIHGGEARNLVPANATVLIPNCTQEQKEILEKVIQEQPIVPGRTFTLEQNDNDSVMLTCKGKSAHAMTPEKGINAILELLKLLNSCKFLLQELRNELSTILSLVGETHNGAAMGLDCHDDVSGELTMNLGKIDFKDDKFTLQFDIRTPVTFSAEEILEQAKSLFQKNGYVLDDHLVKKPLYVPSNSPLIKTLCDVYETVTNEKAVLYSIGGGTYARAFSNCVCFGSVYPDEELTVHSVNERTLTSNVIQNAKMYGLAIHELIK